MLIAKFGEKHRQYLWWRVATGESFRRSTKATRTQVQRMVSTLDHDSRGPGLSNSVACGGDHGTHFFVPLRLASSTLLSRPDRSI